MKKSLLSIFAMATMLLATGCSQEEDLVNNSSNYVDASFTVDLNEGAQSRTLGLGEKVNQLYYGIYDHNTGNVVPVITNVDNADGNFNTANVGEADITGGTATVKMRLVKGQTYDFVFWAQVEGNTHYTINENDLKNITVNYNGDANDETRDAFFASELNHTVVSHFTKTVVLKRPFAQINVGTTKADFEAAKILLGKSPITQSKMIVKNVPTTLNLLDGTVGGPTEATFKMAPLPKEKPEVASDYEILEVQEKEYAHLAMNYVLSAAKGDQEVVEATLEFANASGSINTFTVPQLPIYRNYRTNIIGNILTSNGEFEVIVDAKFDGDVIRELWDGETTVEPTTITEDGKTVYLIATAENLAWVAEQVNSGENTFKDATVRLTADIYLNNQPWTPIGLGDGGKVNDGTNDDKAFQGTFDGNEKVIYGLNVVAQTTSRSLTEGDQLPTGLFGKLNGGTIMDFTVDGANVKHVVAEGGGGIAVVAGIIFNTGTIENVTVKNAVVEGNRYVAGIAGYVYGGIINCTVENVKLTATPDNLTGEYDNGDKVGGIAGLFADDNTNELSGNTVTNVTITGYRDLGGIAGSANAKNVKNNSVTGVVVTVDRTDSEKNYNSSKPTNAGAIVGSYLNNSSEADLTTNGNTSSEATIVGNTDSESAVVTNQEEFKAAIQSGATEIAVAGEVALTNVSNVEELTIVGVGEDAAIDLTDAVTISGATLNLKNITVKRTNTNYVGFQHVAEENYTDCTIDGQLFLYGEAHFVNCTFNQKSVEHYNVWTYGSSKATFENCTFNSAGKSVLVYNEGACGTAATFNGCTFKASQPVEGKAAIEIDGSLLKNTDMHVITINNATVTGFGKGSVSENSLWNDKRAVEIEGNSNTPAGRSIINVDGKIYAYADIPEVLASALTMDAKTIEAKMVANIDLPISSLGTQTGGSGEYKLGGASTESINIDLNNNKLNITTTYWSAIGANNNDATFSIKNGSMTSSQATGTWNSYDLTFANCNYNIEDVVFDKAVAFTNASKAVEMKNVTINETHDYYAMWITAGGQNVEIDGLTIDSGRGIKIDDEYVCDWEKNTHNCEKVTLNVSNATFETQSKAAILVKSAAGADITLSNVDITKVTKDTEYAVWVDEDAAAYADLVRVVGGKMKIEGQIADGVTEKDGVYSISNANGMFWFANEVNVNKKNFSGETVKLVADIDLQNRDWEPIGQTGATEFEGVFDGQNYTIKNLNIDKTDKTDEHTSSGLFGWAESSVTIKNVKVNVANVKGHHNVAVIVGYTYSGNIENCHVTNAEIVCTHANDDACGDKCGLIAGYAGDESHFTDCSASNSTVKAGRDAGQLIGAGYNVSVSNCSATNVTVTATGDCTGKNINEALIGRVIG